MSLKLCPLKISTVFVFFFATTIFLRWFGCAEPTKSDALENSPQRIDVEVGPNLDLDLNPSPAFPDSTTPDLSTNPDIGVKPEPTQISAGYGETEITPPIGTLLGGYGGPGDDRAVTGVHDPLLAQVLVVTNDIGESLILVTLDVAGYFFDFGDWGPGIKALRRLIVDEVSDRLDIEEHQVVIASSHTHSGTDLGGLNQRFGEGVPVVLLLLTQIQVLAAVDAAMNAIGEAEIGWRKTSFEGWSRRDEDCSEEIDTDLTGLQINWTNSIHPPLYVINFANHPTIVSAENTQASADFVWGIRSAAENRKRTRNVSAGLHCSRAQRSTILNARRFRRCHGVRSGAL